MNGNTHLPFDVQASTSSARTVLPSSVHPEPRRRARINPKLFHRYSLFLLFGLAFGWLPSALAADRVKLALPAKSMGYLPLFTAVHRGFFKDESIDIEIPMLLPQLAHNALLSGEIDYHGAADSALRLAAKGAPMKAISRRRTRSWSSQ